MERSELLNELDDNGKRIREVRKKLSDLQFERAAIYERYLDSFMAGYGVAQGDLIRIRFSRDNMTFKEVEGFYRGVDCSNAKVHDTMVTDCKPVLRRMKGNGIESLATVGSTMMPFVNEITDVTIIRKGYR